MPNPTQRQIDAAHRQMVGELVDRRSIRSATVEAAFRTVPRHLFFPLPFDMATNPLATDFNQVSDPRLAYTDAAIRLKPEPPTVSLAPHAAADQLEHLEVAAGMRVLHVGTGVGYYTAVLAELVGERGTVVGVEYEGDLAERSAANLAREAYTNVTVREGDGALGVEEAAPFDRIWVSASAADLFPAWIEQLYDDGRLVVPLCQVGGLTAPGGGGLLSVLKSDGAIFGHISSASFCGLLRGRCAPTERDEADLADGLMRWFALEQFLRADLPIRIVMKPAATPVPAPASVEWFLETRNAFLWVEAN